MQADIYIPFNETGDLINRTLYIARVLNELELLFLFSFYDIFILRELSEHIETHLWRIIRVVIYTCAYWILDFVRIVVFWRITLVSET